MQLRLLGSNTVGDKQSQTDPEMTKLLTQELQVLPEVQVWQTGIQSKQVVPDR